MEISDKHVRVYMIFLAAVGILHHIDHILRYDHSGWPFRPEVTPFTYSLLVYPVIVSLFLIGNPTYRITMSAILAVLVLSAHIFLETPMDQFSTWAHNSSPFSHSLGHPNLLNVRSPLLGVVSVGIGLILDIGIAGLVYVFWKQKQYAGVQVLATPGVYKSESRRFL